jgi:hypothetical protein
MSRRVRLGALLALLAWIALGHLWPGPGPDYVNVRRANLVLSAAAAAVVLLRARGTIREPRHEVQALAALAAVSGLVYTHAFAFRVHYHEFAHYYLGAKYFRELGYGTLYTALLRAEAETTGGVSPAEARDLAVSGELVASRDLLARSQPVRDAFTPARWADFKDDAALLRARLGSYYPTVLRDHGYNPSPLWATLGGTLANRVPAGSARGLRALAVLDPLLLAATFAAVAGVFGLRAALLAAIQFSVVYGATYEWVGGAFLRYMWFAATVLAFCAWQRGRAALGGVLVGFAAVLRVFPVLFLAAAALAALPALATGRRVPRPAGRALAGFAGAVAALAALTALTPGLEAWPAFAENLARHARAPMANLVGLTSAVSTLAIAAGAVSDPQRLRLAARALPVVAGALAALAVVRAGRGRDLPGAAALGTTLVFAALDLNAYYYVFLVVLVLVYRDRPALVAGAFAVEAASYALALAEGSTAVLYAHRSLLLVPLLAATLRGDRAQARPARATLSA